MRRLERLSERRVLLIAVLAVACLGLGAWGFAAYPNLTRNTTLGWLYQSAQLFWWGFWQAPADVPVPWQLETARWLAPLVMASAVFSALGAALRRTLRGVERRAIGGFSRHTVVIGLGAKGSATVNGLLAAGEMVAVIERDEENPAIVRVREASVPVVIGDGMSSSSLGEAGVERAKSVLIVCESELANVRIAGAVRGYIESFRKSGGLPTTIAVHVSDARLAHGVRRAFAPSEDHVRIECVNAQLSGIAMLLSSHPPVAPDTVATVIGSGELLVEFLVVAAKSTAILHPGSRLRISVVSPEAECFAEEFLQRYPGVDDLLDLRPSSVPTVRGLAPDWSGALAQSVVPSKHLVVYVLCDSDDETVTTALLASRFLGSALNRTVVVVLREPESYREILGDGFTVHPLFGAMFDPEIALGGTTELLARATHECYVAKNSARGTGSHLAQLDWADLTESQRAANRDPAADIPRKLAAIGLEISPLTEWRCDTAKFTAQERDTLARMEHERWARFATASGYSWGPERVDVGSDKRHPDLVPWDELTDTALQKDYDAIDDIPGLLAMIGYGVERILASSRLPGDEAEAPRNGDEL